MEPGADGLLRSPVLPGLWHDPAALPSGDLARVMAAILQGIGSAEPAEFVARLEASWARVPGAPPA